jgi:hypothetical protein
MKGTVLYKYGKINKHFIEGLVNSSVYCPPPDKLNDPFDCQIDIEQAVANAELELESGELVSVQFFAKILQDHILALQKAIKIFGICSFTRNRDNSLMWSHYAGDHKGVCVTYDFPRVFLNDPNKIIGILPVDYGDNPIKEWIIERAKKESTDITAYILDLAEKVVSVKSKAWSYEEEHRIIVKNPGLFKYEKNHLKEICFGLNTPSTDIALLKDLMTHRGSSLKYLKMERCKNSDFGLIAKEI